MTGPANHSDLIDSYLSGRMNSSEQAEFEIMLESDPLLKEEFNFQQDIVGGLKEFRKDQLKNRLNQVTVGVGITGLLMNSGIGKLVAAVGTLGLIGIGAYVYVADVIPVFIEEEPVVIEKIDQAINSPKREEVAILNLTNIGENTEEESSNYKELTSLPIVNTRSSKVAETSKSKETVIIEKDGEVDGTNASQAVVKADFVVPAFDDLGEDEETLDGIEIKLPEVRQNVTLKEDNRKVEIENIVATKYDLHYKFAEGKLYLYGDFNNIPYELLEINSGVSRKLYLYHDEVFYKVNQLEQEIVPLKVIRDEGLIEDLEIIRNNKN